MVERKELPIVLGQLLRVHLAVLQQLELLLHLLMVEIQRFNLVVVEDFVRCLFEATYFVLFAVAGHSRPQRRVNLHVEK